MGREILIKVVVQAIPTYTMNCFKLPLGLCDDIEGLSRRFWWEQRGEEENPLGKMRGTLQAQK